MLMLSSGRFLHMDRPNKIKKTHIKASGNRKNPINNRENCLCSLAILQ